MAVSAIFDTPVGNTVVPVNTRSGLETAAVSRRDHSLTIDMDKSPATMRLRH